MPQPSAHTSLGSPFIELKSVESTNNYALTRIHAGLAQHGEAFFAYEQLAGKGQRGRVWDAEKDANITLSIIAKPHPMLLTQQFHLSACVAIAAQEFFAHYAGDETKIKWPNDLYWQDRKAGGILIESVIGSPAPAKTDALAEPGNNKTKGQWQWAVIGIGININQTSFSPSLKNPVSLKQITGKHFNTVELAKELCQRMDHHFKKLIAGEFEDVYRQYLSVLYKKDERVKLKKDNRVFEAVIKAVSLNGKLIATHAMDEEFDFGEVEWVI